MSEREFEELRVALAKLEQQVDDSYDFFLATRAYLFKSLAELYDMRNKDAREIAHLHGRLSDVHEQVGSLGGKALPNVDYLYEVDELVLIDPPPSPGRPR